MLAEGEVFENEVLSGTESAGNPAEEMPEGHSHGKNLIGTIRIELLAKSFILRVYDVLARHSFELADSLRRFYFLETELLVELIVRLTVNLDIRVDEVIER